MESLNYKDFFNEKMTSEEALRTFTTLLKTAPKERQEELCEAHDAVEGDFETRMRKSKRRMDVLISCKGNKAFPSRPN